MRLISRILSALACLSLAVASPVLAGADKPLVIESGKIKQLPSATTLQLQAPTTGAASINLPHGTAPTSPTNGDCWTTSGGLYCQISGATVGPYAVAAAGGSSAQTLITEVITSGSQSNVTFSSIPNTYRDLLVVVRGRGTASATAVNILLQFNSDTGANYDFEDWHAVSTTNAGAQTVGSTSAFVGLLMGATATANRASLTRAYISDYRGTTFDKPIISDGTDDTGTGTFTQGRYSVSAMWRPSSPAAINAVKVFLSSGNFVDGSIVSLYGIM